MEELFVVEELDLNASRVDMALGWLAREEKVAFNKEKRTTLVSLRDD